MTKEAAFRLLANLIWNHDTSKEYGLMPSGFGFKIEQIYKDSSDCLEKEGYTHFTHTWVERGNSVRLTMFKADGLGAVSLEGVPTHVEIIML